MLNSEILFDFTVTIPKHFKDVVNLLPFPYPLRGLRD